MDNHKDQERKKSVEPDKDVTIYQHNEFLAARKDYSIAAHRIMRMAIADIRPKLSSATNFYTREFGFFNISTKQLREILGETNPDLLSEKMDVLVKNLLKPIKVGTNEHNLSFVVFESVKWDHTEGLTLRFSNTMREFLIELDKGNFTKTQLQISFQLSSSYSLVLLELMLQYRGRAVNGIIERTINLDELRFSLNVPDGAYANRMDNFRHCVIDSSIKEINEKTDFHIFPKYEIIRGQYNKVVAFKFTLALPTRQEITHDEDEAVSNISDYLEPWELAERLKSHDIHGRTANRLAKMKDAVQSYKVALKYIRRGEVANKAAYIRKAIEENFFQQQEEIKKYKLEKQREQKKSLKTKKAKPTPPPISTEEMDSPLSSLSDEQLLEIMGNFPKSSLARVATRIFEKRRTKRFE